MNRDSEWVDPVYKKLAASELGAGHTSGIVPTRETQDYFGVSGEEDSHLLKEVKIQFWCGQEVENISANVMYYVSSTHRGQIHITGLQPTYMKFGAQLGDIIVFWKNKVNENEFKTELIKPGSERWDMIDAEEDESFPTYGGFLKLISPV